MGREVVQWVIDHQQEREERLLRNLEAIVQNGVARAFGAR